MESKSFPISTSIDIGWIIPIIPRVRTSGKGRSYNHQRESSFCFYACRSIPKHKALPPLTYTRAMSIASAIGVTRCELANPIAVC